MSGEAETHESGDNHVAIPCAESLGGGSGRHKRQRGCEGRKDCWKVVTVSLSGAGGVGVDVDPERGSPRYHEPCLALEQR